MLHAAVVTGALSALHADGAATRWNWSMHVAVRVRVPPPHVALHASNAPYDHA